MEAESSTYLWLGVYQRRGGATWGSCSPPSAELRWSRRPPSAHPPGRASPWWPSSAADWSGSTAPTNHRPVSGPCPSATGCLWWRCRRWAGGLRGCLQCTPGWKMSYLSGFNRTNQCVYTCIPLPGIPNMVVLWVIHLHAGVLFHLGAERTHQA
jgi:hypothetical protein